MMNSAQVVKTSVTDIQSWLLVTDIQSWLSVTDIQSWFRLELHLCVCIFECHSFFIYTDVS